MWGSGDSSTGHWQEPLVSMAVEMPGLAATGQHGTGKVGLHCDLAACQCNTSARVLEEGFQSQRLLHDRFRGDAISFDLQGPAGAPLDTLAARPTKPASDHAGRDRQNARPACKHLHTPRRVCSDRA